MEQEQHLGLLEQSFNVRYSVWVREVLDELPDSFTITDPCISGHPIVFASRGFLKMSGYLREEVIGKNGRMFQGIKTDRRSVMEIREAIREERTIQIDILNYRKDGTPFWMLFHMCPVFSKEDGRVIHFVGVQVPILRKPRRSGSDFVRAHEVNLCDNGSVLGSCRREVCSDAVAELRSNSALDSALVGDREITDHTCKASDLEKQRASSAMNNVLSVLTHYSELTGRLVCEKRCCLSSMGPLSASLNISLGRIKHSFVLIDPYSMDMPIVYASDPFLELTGYARHEVLGQNSRFLSGQETDLSTQLQITKSIQTGQTCTVCILNYRKNKSAFWNFLHISPVRNATGKIAYFVEVQVDANCSNNPDCKRNLKPEIKQLSVVGAVKVAVRGCSMVASTSGV